MLEILYQDNYLAVVNKPSGLLVHRTGLDAGETRFALQILRDQLGRQVWPVHRLDKGTSGALVFALNADVARTMGQWLEAGGQLQKSYQAIVRGWPQPEEGLVDHPLGRMADDARHGRDSVQAARSRFRVEQRLQLPLRYGQFEQTRCALVTLWPDTGRRHQLRRHMKHISHPIIGDSTHGKGPLNRHLAAFLGHARLWLHARALTLPHPVTGEMLDIGAEPGQEWRVWSRHAFKPDDFTSQED